MQLGFDVDGVLADFNAAFIARVVKVTGRDLFPPRPFDIPCWDYPIKYGYTKEEESAVWTDIKQDPTFWYLLAAYPDTEKVIVRLNRIANLGNDVYFITARPGILAKMQTEDWLCEFGMDAPTVLISHQKGRCAKALDLDMYIDDKWENAVEVAAISKVKTYLMNRPWNINNDAKAKGITRVNSAMEVLDENV